MAPSQQSFQVIAMMTRKCPAACPQTDVVLRTNHRSYVNVRLSAKPRPESMLSLRRAGNCPVFPAEILLSIFMHFFELYHDYFFNYFDREIPRLDLIYYNLENRPFLDRLIGSSSSPLRDVVLEAFWKTLCERAEVHIARRHNTVHQQWAFPREVANRYTRYLSIDLDYADRLDRAATR